MKGITTYLTFDGNCRQAMEFYKRCLGGELFLMPVSESPGEAPKEAKDRIMHAYLKNGSLIPDGSRPVAASTVSKPEIISPSASHRKVSTETEKTFRLSRSKREGYDGAPGHILGRSLRNSRRSVRNPLDVQLRKTEGRLKPITVFRDAAEPTRSRQEPSRMR